MHIEFFVVTGKVVNGFQVAILNGITMGGGARVSIPGTFRLATDRTVCCSDLLSVNLSSHYSFVVA